MKNPIVQDYIDQIEDGFLENSDDVIEYMDSNSYKKEIGSLAYIKYLNGSKDSFKNWIEAENEVYSHYENLIDDLEQEEHDYEVELHNSGVNLVYSLIYVILAFVGIVFPAIVIMAIISSYFHH